MRWDQAEAGLHRALVSTFGEASQGKAVLYHPKGQATGIPVDGIWRAPGVAVDLNLAAQVHTTAPELVFRRTDLDAAGIVPHSSDLIHARGAYWSVSEPQDDGAGLLTFALVKSPGPTP